MNYHELTPRQRERFRSNPICPICGKEIAYEDSCAYSEFKFRKRKAMIFFHVTCLSDAIRGVDYAEEQSIK